MFVAVVAVVAGAMLQSATGFGFALVVAPVLVAVLTPGPALTTVFALAVLLSLMVLFSERRSRHIISGQLIGIVAAAVPGAVVGGLVLGRVSKPALQVVVGVAVLVAGFLQLRHHVTRKPPLTDPPGAATAAVGVTVGVLTTTTGVNGPPMMLWLQRLGAAPEELRDTLAAGFLALNLLGAVVLGVLGEWRGGGLDAAGFALLAAATMAGQVLGRVVFRRINAAHFRLAASVLVIVAGSASVVAGLGS